MDVSIILVNYKTKDITINCIKSIIDKTKNIEYEIILVDNNSKDGTVEEVKKQLPSVKIIENNENLGFAKGCNIGIDNSKGKYILFLNTDTILVENTIKILYDFMERNKDFGVIGTLLTDENDKLVQSWGKFLPFKRGFKEFVIKPFLPRKIKSKITSKVEGRYYYDFEKEFFKDKEYIEVDYIIGADMFVRGGLAREIKFNDEYFMYFEEADFQLKIRKKGFKIGIIRGSRIIHLESKSFKISNAKRTMKMVSFLKYLKNNYLPIYIIYKPLSLIYGFTKTIFDLFIKEYTFKENIIFTKSLLLETYELVKKQ
ncbi:MAG: glycosyltransferase family 2 protein [Brevinematia bacterium]